MRESMGIAVGSGTKLTHRPRLTPPQSEGATDEDANERDPCSDEQGSRDAGWETSLPAGYQSRYGMRTESMTWMTPFDAWMSVATIFAYQLT